jgi:hypothetical protein
VTYPRDPVRCVHFIGFRGDEYWSAAKIWGRPHFIHQRWDLRARRDIGEEDLVVFATGDETSPLSRHNGNDIDERYL